MCMCFVKELTCYCFLYQASTTQLYEVCLNLIQAYAKCNTGILAGVVAVLVI